MSNDWSKPAAPSSNGGGERIDWSQLEGALLGFHVHEAKTVETRFGAREAVAADVLVFDGGSAEENHYEDTLIFGVVLVSQLAPSVGGKVLGRLRKGEARGANNPPWLLEDPTDADLKLAAKGPQKVAAASDAPF